MTFTDQLGDYMKVDDFRCIVFANQVFSAHTKTTSGNIDTYTFSGSAQTALYPVGNLSSIVIEVRRAEDARTGDHVTVKIPASLIPLRAFSVDAEKGTGSATLTFPIRVFFGSSLKQLEEAYGFLASHNKFKTGDEGLRRVDFDDFPKQALREAIANAIAHREYALSGPTLVSVMPSSVEITSLGGLVPGITQEDLGANISMPRNKLLAALMYRLGIIEAWGTGIGRMRSSYGDVDATVEISITPNTFTVKLPNRNALGNTAKPIIGKDAVVEAVRSGCRTRAEIQLRTGFSQSKTIGLLRELVNSGVLRKEGESRNTHYALAKGPKEQ